MATRKLSANLNRSWMEVEFQYNGINTYHICVCCGRRPNRLVYFVYKWHHTPKPKHKSGKPWIKTTFISSLFLFLLNLKMMSIHFTNQNVTHQNVISFQEIHDIDHDARKNWWMWVFLMPSHELLWFQNGSRVRLNFNDNVQPQSQFRNCATNSIH